MKVLTAVLGVSLMFGAGLPSMNSNSEDFSSCLSKEKGLLRGAIIDFIGGEPVPRATLIFEGNGTTHKLMSAADGTYQAELPIDVYRVSVKHAGYCPLQRAPIRVQSGSEVQLNFILVTCALQNVGIIEAGQYKGEECRPDKKFAYDSFQVPSSANSRLDLQVRFGSRRNDKTLTEYEGAMVDYLLTSRDRKAVEDHQKYLPVMVSYDSLTIYADKLTLDMKTFEIEAIGNVLVEDGAKRTQGRKAKVSFEAGTPLVDLIQ